MNIKFVDFVKNNFDSDLKAGLKKHLFSGKLLCHYPHLISAVLLVKETAAAVHKNEKSIAQSEYATMVQAFILIREHLQSSELFFADVLQGGGGIAVNASINEALLLGAKFLYPDTKVDIKKYFNRSQSTADVLSTAGRIVLHKMLNDDLVPSLTKLQYSLVGLTASVGDKKMLARTCLQDAMTTPWKNYFGAWVTATQSTLDACAELGKKLLCVNIGGTVIGGGEGASEYYRSEIVAALSKGTGLNLRSRLDLFDSAQHADDLLQLTSFLRRVSTLLTKWCFDIRLLGSGPNNGFHDLTFSKIMQGSSFFNNKNNPTIFETVIQGCNEINANCSAAEALVSRAELNLNVFEPAMIIKLIDSVGLLVPLISMLKEHGVEGIQVLENSVQL